MKVLVQRVLSACLKIDNETTAAIKNGFLLYVCLEVGDTMEEVNAAVEKISQLPSDCQNLTPEISNFISEINSAITI